MRHFFFCFLFIFVSSLSYGQKDAWRIAEKYFTSFQYASAAKQYEQILISDTNNRMAAERLVTCYEKLNNPEKSEAVLAPLCAQPTVEPLYLKKYAAVLAENGKYEQAAVWYKKYMDRTHDTDARSVLQAYANLADFYRDSTLYSVKKESFNSERADFSPAYYREGIIFCSARTPGKDIYLWDNSPFIDLYWSKDSSSLPVPFDKNVNSMYHEGPATFSSDFDTIFFTRNNYINSKRSGSKDGVMKLKIFYAILDQNKWGRPQNFELNNDEYSIGHPAYSPDHKLYFVSEMPGGLGGTDIYYTKLENGRWLAPVNLGAPVNTPGNEMFPFIDAQGNLFFASNGHAGLGGLDIFKSNFRKQKFEAPKNVGYPINSSRDDFGLIISGSSGYFSSNRGENLKDDNIYSFTVKKSLIVNMQAATQEGGRLENFSLSIIDLADTTNNVINYSVKKSYDATLSIEREYKIACAKKGYQTKEEVLAGKVIRELYASRKPYTIILAEGVTTVQVDLVNSEGKRLIGGAIWVVNSRTNEVKKYVLHDDAPLQIELMGIADYELTGQHIGFKTKTQSISALDIENSISIELVSNEVLFEKNEIGQIIELDIKYDLGKATIRSDAAKELNKLVEFLVKNPTIKVELGSHTDVRGTEEDNLRLSQRRAESAVQYIVKKGIKSERLIPLGYGEDDLKVRDAVTERDHQLNRRTTIKIVGI